MFTIERIPFIKRKHSSHSTFLIKNSPHVTGPCWCYCWRILYNCTHPGVYTHKQVLIYHILSPSCLDKNWQRVSAFHPPPPVPGSTRAAGTLRSSVHCCRWEGGGGAFFNCPLFRIITAHFWPERKMQVSHSLWLGFNIDFFTLGLKKLCKKLL